MLFFTTHKQQQQPKQKVLSIHNMKEKEKSFKFKFI
jgi:hypothetical protein